MAALGGVLRLSAQMQLGLRRYRGCIAKLGDRREHLPPVTEQDADLLQVLIGQVRKYREINPVFSKALRVLRHAELFEPVRNLLHRGGILILIVV